MYFADSKSSGAISEILLIAIFVGAFYFLLLRPMKRRQKQAAQTTAQMRSQLGPGDEIVTIGGMYATVVDMDDDSVTLEISPGVTARYDRAAIARIVTQEAADAEAEAEDPDDDDSAEDASDSDLEITANSVIEKRD